MNEDIGKINKSFRYLHQGNALRKRLLQYSINQDQAIFSKLKEVQPVIQENSLKVEDGLNGFELIFVVGMPRSGTTLIEQIISSHSRVQPAGELTYVSRYGGDISLGILKPNRVLISEFRKNYTSAILKLADGNKIITDKMPQNFRFIPLI